MLLPHTLSLLSTQAAPKNMTMDHAKSHHVAGGGWEEVVFCVLQSREGIYHRAMVLKLQHHLNHLKGLLKFELPGPTLEVSDSVGQGTGQGQGLRVCISNRFLDAAAVAAAPKE